MGQRFSRIAIAQSATLAVAALALSMLVASGPGTRSGLWSWQAGLGFFKWAAYIGIAAGAAALVLLLLLAIPRFRVRPWLPVLALCIAATAVAPPAILLSQAKRLPAIHDITTDTQDPPAFVALREVRAKSPNGHAYGGAAVAAKQREAYADIQPLSSPLPPREAHQKALDAARDLGWEIVSSDAPAGRIEATATTSFFGFRDDVVVRIRPEGAGSRVDVRSVSRVGLSDVGANARRIRKFLERLA